jgi:hypothetical protein
VLRRGENSRRAQGETPPEQDHAHAPVRPARALYSQAASKRKWPWIALWFSRSTLRRP